MNSAARFAIPMAFSALAAFQANHSVAGVDMFLKIASIPGESMDAKHIDEIDVLAWSWQASTPSDVVTGAGAPIVRPIRIEKNVDSSTPQLFERMLSGTTISDATLVVRSQGGTPLEYLKIEMTKVLITSISNSGAGADSDVSESVSLNFSDICFTYTPQSGTGGTLSVCYDVAGNIVNP